MIKTETFEDVTQIKMGREMDGRVLYWVSAYLVDGLLIDTGPKHTASELVSFLEDKGLEIAVNTHYHEDHIGGNSQIKDRFNIDIYAHRLAAPLIKNPPPILSYQEMVWGFPDSSDVLPLGSKIKTESSRFDVIEIPGHSVGDIALVELDRGYCFSGDLFITERPKTARREEDVVKMIDSMKKLLSLDTERLVLFTSGDNIYKEGKESLARCVEYLEYVYSKAFESKERGMAIGDMVTEIFGRETSLSQLTEGDFSSENLLTSLLGK